MEARYLTDENGGRIGVVLDVEEYGRLREMEDALKDARRVGSEYEEPTD